MSQELLTARTAAGIFEPLRDGLADAHKAAFELWRELPPKYSVQFEPAERAQVLHAYVRWEILNRVGAWSDVRPTKALEFFAVAVGSAALVRFKFLGHGAPRNHDSLRQRRLAKQQYSEEDVVALALDGISGPLTVLTCGYRLTVAEDAISQIVIRRDLKGYLPWEHRLYGEGASIEPMRLEGTYAPEETVVVSSKRARNAEPSEGEAEVP